jgi:hypothetical protein
VSAPLKRALASETAAPQLDTGRIP